MREQYRGQAILEVPVLRLVVERAHAAHRADAPAEDREQEQRLFRHAPLAPLRAALVRAEREERGEVDDEQIRRQREGEFAAHASSLHSAAAVFAASSALL